MGTPKEIATDAFSTARNSAPGGYVQERSKRIAGIFNT
jgi:hypothetical protein